MNNLNSIYESTNIKPKKPFTEENLRNVVDQYNRQYSDDITMSLKDDIVELSNPKDQFSLIDLIEMTLQRNKGYKLDHDKFIIPLS